MGRSAPVESAKRMRARRMSSIARESLEWLWPGKLPLGAVSMIGGDPGLSKSTLAIDLAARVSTGRRWPDGSPNQRGSVVLLCSEDDPSRVIRPRLDAHGADVERIILADGVDRVFDDDPEPLSDMVSIPRDVDAIESLLDDDARLVIIDPLSEYLNGVDSHVNSEVRQALRPLNEMAIRRKVCVLLIHHLNKASGASAIHRLSGSLGFGALARTVWVVTRDKDDLSKRLFLPAKSNWSADTDGLAYYVRSSESVDGVAEIHWADGAVRETADAALSHESPADREERTQAESFLTDLLGSGPVAAREVFQAAKDAGIPDRTLNRAKARLGVKVERKGFGKSGRFEWSLPPKPLSKYMATYGSLWQPMGSGIDCHRGPLIAIENGTDGESMPPELASYYQEQTA